MKKFISNVLSFLLPFEEPLARKSVFIQEKWIENVMRSTQIQDYLWHAPKSNN